MTIGTNGPVLGVAGLLLALFSAAGCRTELRIPDSPSAAHPIKVRARFPQSPPSPLDLALENLREQIRRTRRYDPAYTVLAYPGGDVPMDRGVCSDVIVRALRAAGIDLQVEVHRDMGRSFSDYPGIWGLRRPDPNIDHRRVPNLMTFLNRRRLGIPPSRRPDAYQPGDIVAWELPGGRLHVGMVADSTGRPMIVHNIGRGAMLEDVLFAWKIIGRYRLFENGHLRAIRQPTADGALRRTP